MSTHTWKIYYRKDYKGALKTKCPFDLGCKGVMVGSFFCIGLCDNKIEHKEKENLVLCSMKKEKGD